MVTDTFQLFVYDFNRVKEINLNLIKLPKSILFLGKIVCILMEYNETLMAIFHCGTQQKLIFNSKTLCFQEDNRLIFLNENGSDFFEFVSDPIRHIFQIGSEEASSAYYDYYSENKVPNFDMSQEALRQCILECIDAAKSDPEDENLICAAQQGNLYLQQPIDDLCMVIKRIRVIRALHQNGMPISFDQFVKKTLESFLIGLVNKKLHNVASKIGEYLEANVAFVWRDWAIQMVFSHHADDYVYQLIKNYNDIEVARKAYYIGKRKLASMLLETDRISQADKMVLLLTMKEFFIALRIAKESLDTNLYQNCLINMKLEEIVFALQDEAFSVIRDFYLSDFNNAMGYYKLLNNQWSLGLLYFKKMEWNECLTAWKDFPSTLEYKMTEQMISVQKDYPHVTCLSDLIQTLIKFGKLDEAKKTSSSYGMSKKKFSWIHLRVTLSLKKFTECESMALEQSQIEFFLDSDVPKEISTRWIEQILDYESRVEYFLKYGFITEAAELAFSNDNIDLLEMISSKVSNPQTKEIIQDLITKCKN